MIKGNLCPFCHLLSTQVANVSPIWTPNRAKYWFDIKTTTSPALYHVICDEFSMPIHSHPFMSNPEGKNVEKTDLVLPMFHLSSAIFLITFRIKLRFHHPSIVGICIMSAIWVSTFYDGPITVNIWRHIICGAQHLHLHHSWNQFPCGLLTFPSSSV